MCSTVRYIISPPQPFKEYARIGMWDLRNNSWESLI
jgi:hypothetical protein